MTQVSLLHLGYENLFRKKRCDPTGFSLEHLFKSIFYIYTRLKELGFTYYNGIVSIINMEGEAIIESPSI